MLFRSISTLYPFAIWGVDLIGLLPTTPGQAKHAIVAIDYFTRWVEAESLTRITEANTKGFIQKKYYLLIRDPYGHNY